MKVPTTENRGKGFTLFGAISPCIKGNAYFEVHNSTKGTCFMHFMTNLQKEILPGYKNKKLILVADNHGAHKGPAKMELLEKFCEVHFIPTYSCELNGPIETAWSIIKRRVVPKFTKLQLKLVSSRDACIQQLRKELKRIDPKIFLNLTRSHYCYLATLLEEMKEEFDQINRPHLINN